MNPFAWILLTVPAFLLVRGKLSRYIELAAKEEK